MELVLYSVENVVEFKAFHRHTRIRIIKWHTLLAMILFCTYRKWPLWKRTFDVWQASIAIWRWCYCFVFRNSEDLIPIHKCRSRRLFFVRGRKCDKFYLKAINKWIKWGRRNGHSCDMWECIIFYFHLLFLWKNHHQMLIMLSIVFYGFVSSASALKGWVD